MIQNYEQLAQDIVTLRKDLNQIRLKNTQLQSELKSTKEQLNQQKMINDRLMRQKNSEVLHAKHLESEIQQLRSQYETNLNDLRIQVESRQIQMQNARGTKCVTVEQLGPQLDYELMRMKIMRELEQEYGGKLEQRQSEIEQMRNAVMQANRSRQFVQEKLRLLENQSRKQLDDMRQSHILEIEHITKTLGRAKSPVPSDQRQNLRRLRREVEELRVLVQQKDHQLKELHDQRTNIRQSANDLILSNTKQNERLREEVRIHRDEVDRLQRQINQHTAIDRDRQIVASRDKQIKQMEQEIEELHDSLKSKDTKIHRLQQDIVEKQSDILRLTSKQQLNEDRQQLQITRNTLQQIQRDMRNLQERYDQVRIINEQLTEREDRLRREIRELRESHIYKSDTANIANKQIFRDTFKDTLRDTVRDTLKDIQKTDYDTHISNKQRNDHNTVDRRNVETHHTETHTTKVKIIEEPEGAINQLSQRYARRLDQQNRRIEELIDENNELVKALNKQKKNYTDCLKKYETAKRKLQQANDKIMELLQQKIRMNHSPQPLKLETLLSPAPTIKKIFNFTSQERTAGSRQPDPIHIKQSFHIENRRQFRSPQPPQPTQPLGMSSPQYTAERPFNFSIGSAGRSSDQFYQRSKSFKASKGRVICINHDKPVQP